jgi:hypothetical protein
LSGERTPRVFASLITFHSLLAVLSVPLSAFPVASRLVFVRSIRRRPAGDANDNGLPNFLAYALGEDPSSAFTSGNRAYMSGNNPVFFLWTDALEVHPVFQRSTDLATLSDLTEDQSNPNYDLLENGQTRAALDHSLFIVRPPGETGSMGGFLPSEIHRLHSVTCHGILWSKPMTTAPEARREGRLVIQAGMGSLEEERS